MNNLLYSGYTKNVSTGDEYFKNYTTLLLNPYYELDNDDWKLHIGANVDLSFGFDKSFRISPDITAQYIFSDSYIVYAKATGGKQLNDFRRLESICLTVNCRRQIPLLLWDTYNVLMILTSKSTVVSDSKQALIRDFGSTCSVVIRI